MLKFEGGQPTPLSVLLEEIASAQREHGIEGISLIGGEPTAHADGAAPLAREVQRMGLSVMVYSGYTLEALQAQANPLVRDLLAHTDLLVDGPYLKDQPESNRRWIGSANQRVHFLSQRYREDDPNWQQPNTLEIRLENGQLSVNGFPARAAVGLWKRPPQPKPPASEKPESKTNSN